MQSLDSGILSTRIMCIYQHACKFESQIFKNHHKLMSLETQSHFPSPPAKESEGGSRQDWEEGEAEAGVVLEAGHRRRCSPAPQDLGLITSSHCLCCRLISQLQPPNLLIGNPCLCQDPRAPRLLSFFHIMQTPWLGTAAFATSPVSTSAPSRQVL